MADTVSDALLARLIDWGVDTIFGIPGDGINGFMEALRKRRDEVRFVHTRHEETAALAACAYAKFTGRLGLCLSTAAKMAQDLAARLPDRVAAPMMEKAGIDRLRVLRNAIDAVRRGGTISLSGVYGGMADSLPMMELFDKQIQLRMGQANVHRWIPDVLPLVEGDGDPLGVEDLATHHLPLEDAPRAYEMFQKKQDGAIKVILHPSAA